MFLVAKLKAKAGKEGAMEEVLREMVSKVEQEEGCLLYTLHRSQTDPTVFLFYEEYRDAEAVDYHRATSHYKELTEVLLPPLLDGHPDVEAYDEITRIRE
jgi:quinol monooxygenase YgiN